MWCAGWAVCLQKKNIFKKEAIRSLAYQGVFKNGQQFQQSFAGLWLRVD